MDKQNGSRIWSRPSAMIQILLEYFIGALNGTTAGCGTHSRSSMRTVLHDRVRGRLSLQRPIDDQESTSRNRYQASDAVFEVLPNNKRKPAARQLLGLLTPTRNSS